LKTVETTDIARLLAPFIELEPEQLQQVSLYLSLLLKWNARINLTAVRQPDEMVTRHFGESFFAGKHLWSAFSPNLTMDLGSGPGFPGLPCAILAPDSTVLLVESNNKKVAFLKEVIFALKLRNVKVFCGRAESCTDQAPDLVTMRAVEKFESSLPVALGLVRPGGRIALMIGEAQMSLARKIAGHVEWQEPIAVPGGHSRVLFTGTKAAE
jgi:16S rRNA (guanine527-N7)-methyltransferase